ncbi:membrane protein [Borreliella chilensis]|uniref:Membrane protein n=1 Tax=Borreliella chilensis TaxID=1245910 RepID=A0A0A7UVD8_9SPIR|nr:membrane protein [Borreliella chilensis]
MIIKILLLLLINPTSAPIAPNKIEKNISNLNNKITSIETEKNIKAHIKKINQLSKGQEKIINTFNYIKEYFNTNEIKYMEYSLQEIGFIGYSQKIIHSKIKGKSVSTYNIIIPIKIQNNLKNNLAIGIAIEFLSKLKNTNPENNLNFFFIEDDSLEQNTIISSRILLSNNYLGKNTNTIYLMLSENKIKNKICLENESYITNSKTNLEFLKAIIKNFEKNKLDFNTTKITEKKLNNLYNLYRDESIPFLIINNNLKSILTRNKNTIFEIYKSIEEALTSEYKSKNTDEIHYIIIDAPFKKIIINEIALIALIYICYNLIIIVFIRKFKEAGLVIKKVKNNYYKLVRLFFTLFLSTYLSLLITNKIFVNYDNTTAYNITNPKYLITFFATLLIHNLLSLFTYNFTIHLNSRQLKYLAISTSIVELIILMFIKIEFILIIIIKSILLLIKPNKNNIIQKITVITIWIINFVLTTLIQNTTSITNTLTLSYIISICLFSTILINISEHLKSKFSKIKQNFKKAEKLSLVTFFLIIAIIISSNIDKKHEIQIEQTVSFPEKTNKIKIEYLKGNKNPIQIISNDFNLTLQANEKTLKTSIKADDDLMNIDFKKIDIAERAVYSIDLVTQKIANQIELHFKNASKLIIYQSNTPYKILANKIIFSLKNINSKKTTIAFTLKSQDDIAYEAFANLHTKKNQVKIYNKTTNKEEKNIKINYSCRIKYSGILPKAEKYKNLEYFKLKDDKEIENLKTLKLN